MTISRARNAKYVKRSRFTSQSDARDEGQRSSGGTIKQECVFAVMRREEMGKGNDGTGGQGRQI